MTSLPASVGQLTQVRYLDASNNELTSLPAAICQLIQVVEINVSHNKLITLLDDFELSPESVAQWHEVDSKQFQANSPQSMGLKGRFAKSECTILHGQNLDIPTFVRKRIAFPTSNSVGQLSRLQKLNLSYNFLVELPDNIGLLTQLQELNADHNQLTVLPQSIGQLVRMHCLVLSNNRLRSLPDSLRALLELQQIWLLGNPDLGIPPEVVDTPYRPGSVLEYYWKMEGGRRPLNEAKMILVGRGGVGKTCLVNRLVHGTYRGDQRKTDGIAITHWHLSLQRDTVRLNIWDFGGQEIMHATHQLFLTKRSLYLLVLNAREGEQDTNVEYWLRLIESFSGYSPVIVVINKVADHPFDLNRRGLQAKFPAIRGFVHTDCETGLGLDELRRLVLRETDSMEHLRDPFPASWFTVKDTLANLPKNEGTNYIPFTRFQELCANNGVTEKASQETLVGFLHDLGIVVNFRDNPRLSETQVLDPEWVTNGIYKILNAECLARSGGELHLPQLLNALDNKTYPREMHLYLLDLMRKFELCYEFYGEDGRYLVPELLGKEEPDSRWEIDATISLQFEYHYNILTEGLVPRFIVRSRALNKNLPRWRTGVVLEWDGNRAVVKADVQDRRLSIAVTGPKAGRRRLLAVIRSDLEHIHRSIAKLQATEQVPVPGYSGLSVEFSTLCVLEAAGEMEIKLVHNGTIVKQKVIDLLDGIEESAALRRSVQSNVGNDVIRLAFSYSHKDEELRDQLETHLKLLQRQNVISTWHDRKIRGGEDWAGVIDENFRLADVILLLVSADFLASDYCYQTEMGMALEREANGEARVVPVLLRACDWQGARFSKLQGLPKDMKPVTSWPNRDEAWTDVAAGIRRIAEVLRS